MKNSGFRKRVKVLICDDNHEHVQGISELIKVEGGAIKGWLIVGAGIAVFIAGVIDGYLRPLRCN